MGRPFGCALPSCCVVLPLSSTVLAEPICRAMVRPVPGGVPDRLRAAWSDVSTPSRVAAGLVVLGMLGTVIGTSLAAIRYNDQQLVEDQFCQQNKFRKEALGQQDILNATTVCNSSIVLNYTMDQLEGPLRAAYLAQTVTGALLTAAAPPALVGLLLGWRRRWLLLVWAVADLAWCCALGVSAVALAPFGFPTFVPMLAGLAAASLVVGGLVGGLAWCSRRHRSEAGYELTTAGGDRELQHVSRVRDQERDDTNA